MVGHIPPVLSFRGLRPSNTAQLVFDLTSVGRDRGVYIPLNSRLFLQDDIDYFGYFIYQYKLDLFI